MYEEYFVSVCVCVHVLVDFVIKIKSSFCIFDNLRFWQHFCVT